MVETINLIIMFLFFLCYSYQFIYVPISIFIRPKPHKEEKLHSYAVLIAARNEEEVIGNLVDSIKAQDYPADLIDIYVVADNCTDQTEYIARAHGAYVYSRFDTTHIGKGYALNYLLNKISHEKPDKKYDAYMVFDADNILAKNYITEMNKTLSDGIEIATSYRNTKNYGDNWISAGYGLWFIKDSKYLNHSRMILGTSCAVAGTGFMFSDRILKKYGGWNFFLLSEDTEFSIAAITDGEKIGYCPTAVLFDEQPTVFRQSWRQRLRWARGYLQVFVKYGKQLISGIFHGSFSCFDMTMNIMPAALLTGVSFVVNLTAAIVNFVTLGSLTFLAVSMIQMLSSIYLTFFMLGLLTTITEWKNIYASAFKKILYIFTFPIFMLTYVPIGVVSLFKKAEWHPIKHSRQVSLDDITGINKK